MSDQPDLCCTHGEPILQRLDRLVELMEIVAETRAQTPNLATGGIVQGTAGHATPIIQRGCEYVVDEAYLWTKDRPAHEAIRFYLNRPVKAEKTPQPDQD